MAKNKSDNGNGAAETEGTVQETNGAATTAAAGSDDRFKKVKKPDGTVVNRKDYILELYQVQKWSRGAIAKHLTELNTVENGGTGKKIAYQIVFATTKGKPGGPDPVTPQVATPAPEGQAA